MTTTAAGIECLDCVVLPVHGLRSFGFGWRGKVSETASRHVAEKTYADSPPLPHAAVACADQENTISTDGSDEDFEKPRTVEVEALARVAEALSVVVVELVRDRAMCIRDVSVPARGDERDRPGQMGNGRTRLRRTGGLRKRGGTALLRSSALARRLSIEIR